MKTGGKSHKLLEKAIKNSNGNFTERKIKRIVNKENAFSHEQIEDINKKKLKLTGNRDKGNHKEIDPFSGEELKAVRKLHYYFLYDPDLKKGNLQNIEQFLDV